MTMTLDMTGKVVIVTGGSRGVGLGITRRFLEAGAHVVVCGRNAPEAPIGVTRASTGGRDPGPDAGGGDASAASRDAVFVQADVREVEQIDRVVTSAVEQFGRLDVLVNNAGGAPPADAATASPRFAEAIVRLNLLAPLNFAQRANAAMQEQAEGGCIINIASVSGVRPSPGTAAYGAAKAGLLSLTQSLAVEWAPKVRVNAITAGMIHTEQADRHYGDSAGVARVAATVPLGRLGEPADVGDVCLFLASPLARYVSGASILLHGGGERPVFLAAAKAAPHTGMKPSAAKAQAEYRAKEEK